MHICSGIYWPLSIKIVLVYTAMWILQCYVNILKRTGGIREVVAVLEYFRCVIGSTAEACQYFGWRSDSDMLRVWFSCSPSVSSGCSVKMVAMLEVCTKDKQH
jgi:hypothetical protein